MRAPSEVPVELAVHADASGLFGHMHVSTLYNTRFVPSLYRSCMHASACELLFMNPHWDLCLSI